MSTSSHRGFTLFEVALALALTAIGVVSTLLVLPSLLKAQQHARWEAVASVVVLQSMQAMSHPNGYFPVQQLEAREPYSNATNLDALDIERFLQGEAIPDALFSPLPDTLARRIDSDDDEIARLLDQGGRLYYLPPYIWPDGEASVAPVSATAALRVGKEGRQLLFGVVGYAQQNGLLNHPCRTQPYTDYWPSPPVSTSLDGTHNFINTEGTALAEFVSMERMDWVANNWSENDTIEAAAIKVHQNSNLVIYQSMDNYSDIRQNLTNCYRLARLLNVPMEDFDNKGFNDMFSNDGAIIFDKVPRKPQALPTPPWAANNTEVYPDPRWVMVLRWMAHAAMLMTRPNLDAALMAGDKRPVLVDFARRTYEAGLAWQQRYVTNPNDWGTPRAVQLSTCFDYPLLQYDLFPKDTTLSSEGNYPLPLPLNGGDGVGGDGQWMILSGRPVTNHGVAWGWLGTEGRITNPNVAIKGGGNSIPDMRKKIEDSFSSQPHFTLCDRFSAAERCRQIVAWAVDWQSWEDFESAPSATIDARQLNYDSSGRYVNHYSVRVPGERGYVWHNEDRTSKGRAGSDLSNPALVTGYWGADRNGNGRWDQGPIPRTARLRATTIARFNVYDPRLFIPLRGGGR